MPGEAIIGKVAVKVIPDTKKFKQELEAQLKRIEKDLSEVEVKVQPKINDAAVKAEAKKARETAQRQMKDLTLAVDLDNQDSLNRALANLNRQLERLRENHRMKVGLDEASIQDAITFLEEKLDAVKHIELRIDENSQTSVERAIRQIDAEIEKLNEKKIKVHLDQKSLIAERDKLQKILDHGLAIEMNLAHDAAAKAKLQAEAIIQGIQAQLSSLEVGMHLEPNEAAKLRAEIEGELLKLNDLNVKLKAELDPIAKRKLELEIEATQRRIGDLKVKIGPELDPKKVAIVETALKVLTRTRDVVIKPVINNRAFRTVAAAIDRISGMRVGRDTADAIRGLLVNLDRLTPKLTAVGLGIFGLAGAGLSASANLFALAQALAQILGIVLALPGAFVSAGLAIGVAVLALKDFSKKLPDIAAKFGTLQKLISDNFWSQAETPMRNMLNKLFPQIERGIKKLSTSLGKFFANMSNDIAKVFDNGALERMIGNVASGIDKLSEHTNAFARIFRVLGDVGSKFFERLLDDLGKASEGWANWLEEAEKTGRLQEIIDNAYTALKNVWRVGGAVIGIFNGIADAAKAALGKDILDSLASGLEKVEKIVKGDTFQRELTAVFKSASDAMHEIADRAGPALEQAFRNLSALLQQVLPDVGATLGELFKGVLTAFNQPEVQTAIANFFGALKGAAEELAPAWDNVGRAIGAVVDLMATFVTGTISGAGQNISLIADALERLARAMSPFVSGVAEAAGRFLGSVARAVYDIADALARFFESDNGAKFTEFLEKLADAMGAIVEAGGKVISEVVDRLSPVIGRIADTLSPLLDEVKRWFDENGDRLARALGDIATSLGDILTSLVDLLAKEGLVSDFLSLVLALLEAIAGILKFIAGAIGVVKEFFDELGKFFGSGTDPAGSDPWGFNGFDNFKKNGEGFLDWLGGFLSDAAGPLGLLWDLIRGGGGEGEPDFSGGGPAGGAPGTDPKSNWGGHAPGDVITGFIPGIVDGIQNMFGTASSTFNTQGGAFGAVWNQFFGGLGGNLPNLFSGIPGTFDGLFGKILGGLSGFIPGFDGPWSGLFGDKVPGRVRDSTPGILGGLDGIFGGMLGGLGRFIPGFGGLWDGLWGDTRTKTEGGMRDVNGRVKQGFSDADTSTRGGLSQMLGSVSGGFGGIIKKFSSLPGSIVSALGNLGGTLVQAGKDVIRGFLSGISSMWGSVRKTLTSLTNLLPSWKGPASRDKTILFDSGRLVMGGFIDGLESRFGDVKKSLQSFTRDNLNSSLTGLASGNLDGSLQVEQRVLIYNAAPGSSFSSEEDLFAAANRARMGW